MRPRASGCRVVPLDHGCRLEAGQEQCKYIEYLRTRETLAKVGHNFVQTVRRIEQEEKGWAKPQSGTQIVNEAGVTIESTLSWLGKIFAYKARSEASANGS